MLAEALLLLTLPGAGAGSGQGTVSQAINAAGAITGYYVDGNGVYHGFLRAACVTPPDLCAGVTCTASDQCHVAGTCDPATGMCSNPPKANGTACNDGNACTT